MILCLPLSASLLRPKTTSTKRKRNLEKSSACYCFFFFLSSLLVCSVIFWFQCTHELEHIQIFICLLIIFFFQLISRCLYYVTYSLSECVNSSGFFFSIEISSRYRTCTQLHLIVFQAVDAIAVILSPIPFSLTLSGCLFLHLFECDIPCVMNERYFARIIVLSMNSHAFEFRL